ncbi:MAG: uracil-DNA glycosylase, partial [Proteobacteria bacterium]|nr:uracil-DNA glycosylase [Pseudomonadota bacterium]
MFLGLFDNLTQLREHLLTSFTGCADLRAGATHLVFGEGAVGAPLLVIGEAPGADEDRMGRPFVGRSGKLLRRLLTEAGFGEQELYITNTVFWRPPNNRPPTPAEVLDCAPFLREHIQLVAPRALLLVGATAARAILQRDGSMAALRDCWHAVDMNGEKRPARVVFHPAYLL